VELTKYVDKLGYRLYWLIEHHSTDALAGSSPKILASHLLAKTDNLKIIIGGYVTSL
jgi:alkanesulfonate monooxygenase SsuD/methylene tetrahydromethanopterin reductase-like flavin-dependent oxidoreductase (luciferase family)